MSVAQAPQGLELAAVELLITSAVEQSTLPSAHVEALSRGVREEIGARVLLGSGGRPPVKGGAAQAHAHSRAGGTGAGSGRAGTAGGGTQAGRQRLRRSESRRACPTCRASAAPRARGSTRGVRKSMRLAQSDGSQWIPM